MKLNFIFAIFRRLSAPMLAAVLLIPGATAADDVALPESLPAVASSGNLMNGAVYDALLSAGASEEQARAAAQSVADTNQFVTKTDLAEAKSELKGEIAHLVADTNQFVTKTDLAEAKSELKGEIAHLRNDLILLGAATAGVVILMMVGGFHLLWRRLSELAERLPHARAATG